MLARHPIPFCAACMRKPPDRIKDPEALMKKIMGEKRV